MSATDATQEATQKATHQPARVARSHPVRHTPCPPCDGQCCQGRYCPARDAASGLVQDQGFHRVIHGNAFEGPHRKAGHQMRAPQSWRRLRRALRGVLAPLFLWVNQPGWWQRRKGDRP